MFVRLVKKNNDHVSIRIVENNRVDGKVKQKTVCCVGHFHKDNIQKIETHKKIAEEMIVKIKNEIMPAFPGMETHVHSPQKRNNKTNQNEDLVSVKNLKEEARVHNGIDDIFGTAYDQLNLFDSIDTGYKKDESNQLMKQMVLERLENPVSKRKSVKNIKRDKDLDVDLDRVYRMMDKVYANVDRIKNKICNSTLDLLNQKIDVAFFDVTTLYFESFSPDELRKSGFSKDNKFKETQVMLSLITTTDGLPIGYELFPGNTYEGSTLITAIEQIEKQYSIANTFIVADRAMFTESNLTQLNEKKVKFIVAAKLKSTGKDLKEQILTDVESARGGDDKLSFWVKDYEYKGRRLVVSYSSKRANKDRKDRERLVERINKKMKDGKVRLSDLINNTGTKKYLKIEKKGAKEATLNEDKIKSDKRWDGIHGVITNHTSDTKSSMEVLEVYKGLWQIEAAFRVNKHDLKMRPIYHWSPRRIKAHILLCFIAYSLVSIVRYKLKKSNIKISVEELREELTRVQVSIVKDKKTGKRFTLPSKITPTQKAIYKTFNLSLQEKPKLFK